MLLEQCGARQDERTINPAASVTVGVCADPLVRTGLEEILKATRFTVSAEQPDLDDISCDLLIVDERHYANGLIDLIGALKARHQTARVVILADQFDFCGVMSARHAGADGFCLTSTRRDVMIRALELVMLGEAIVPSVLILKVMSDGARKIECSLWRWPENLNHSVSARQSLSSREIKILHWLMEGAPNKVIARNLDVAEATVKAHIKMILRKTGAGNRTQAAIWAAGHLSDEAAAE